MQVAVAQMNPVIGALEHNADRMILALAQAKQQGADLVIFPELALCGYPPEDLLLLPNFIQAMQRQLERIIAQSQGIAALIGTVRSNPQKGAKPLFNSVAILQDGELLGFQDKTLLAEYDVFFERRYFAPAQSQRVWKIWGCNVGVTVCEDIWYASEYPLDPLEHLAALKPQYLFNLSASPYYQGRLSVRKEIVAKAACKVKAPLVYCNQVGGNDSLVFDGYSFITDKEGNLIRLGKGFQEDFFIHELVQSSTPISLPEISAGMLFDALVLGVRDYFHKQGFKQAVLGLSGGIDSAVVACVAKEALGAHNVIALTMPSRYTSKETLQDAIELAKNLQIPLHTVPIETPFKSYLDLLDPFWESHSPDTTEENLQARIRGMILMAFSNKLGSVVLTCGNKSEMAMGYMTLYGDMCGGLSVLSDVTKRSIYELAAWINAKQPIIPPTVLTRPPSAELRPYQKDSDSLPDYAIVDSVLEDYVEEHLGLEQIIAKRGYDRQLVQMLIERIHCNEYKRRQAPIGLRVTPKAFTAGRRFPIVQGWEPGYAKKC